MARQKEELLQEVTWEDVRADVKQVNPEFANIIDKLNPGKNLKLIKAIYSFGNLIVDNGILNLPVTKFRLAKLGDPLINQNITKQLNYSPIPLFLTLKKSHEVFIEANQRVIPLNLFKAGSLLGLFESIDSLFNDISRPKWSVSAGTRSIFMVPKINETIGFRRLRAEYALPSSMQVQQLSDHWELFKEIATHPNFKQKWQSEVLFFTDEWMIKHQRDLAWYDFRNYLFQMGWQQAKFAMGKNEDRVDISLAWRKFTEIISSRRLKPTPYLADHVKHIVTIAAGRWPGFRPADDLQEVAPIIGLQDAFISVYQLRKYYPTIMYASLFNRNEKLPIYYSLNYPTLLEGSAYNYGTSTLMMDLRDIKLLLDIFKEIITSTGESIDKHILEKSHFEYFHVEQDKLKEIKSSKVLAFNDPRLKQGHDKVSKRILCTTSSFWRGCIQILTL